MTASRYEKTEPKLAAWLAANVPEALTVFLLPPEHRRRLRTTNLLERLSRLIKRRTRVAGLCPNEASLLRLVSDVLMEISEEWETVKLYLRMEDSKPDRGRGRMNLQKGLDTIGAVLRHARRAG